MSDCQTLGDVSAKHGPIATASEVAHLLRCGVDSVYRLVKAGRLQGYCLNGESFDRKGRGKKGLRIFVRSVDDFLAGFNARSTEASPPPVVEEQTPPPPEIKKPQRKPTSRGRSKVSLPYPGQNRSMTDEASPSAETGDCSVA